VQGSASSTYNRALVKDVADWQFGEIATIMYKPPL
jgi:hypothetical protein